MYSVGHKEYLTFYRKQKVHSVPSVHYGRLACVACPLDFWINLLSFPKSSQIYNTNQILLITVWSTSLR